MKKYISIDIGGTKIKHGIINEISQIEEKNEVDTEAHLGGKKIIEKVKKIVNEYINKQEISGICISTAGMVDCEKGEIIYAGKQIPDYIGTNWKSIIKDEFNLPCEVENDVNCAGLSEAIVGAGKGKDICVCLTIGTGIGACMVIDGKVFHGYSSSAFEVGYMHLKDGSFQDLASTTALIKNIAKRENILEGELDGKMIFDLAKKGEAVFIEEIDRLLDYLSIGISNICYIANPQVIILGGGIMEQKEYLAPRLEKSMKKYLLPNILKKTAIEFAQNKNSAGMLGAYYHFVARNN